MKRCLLLCLLLSLSQPGFATDFSFLDMQGKPQRLSDYRGKWLLVNFWATWCPPCLEEIPDLVSLHEARKDNDLAVIGVAIDSPRSVVTAFAAKAGISYPLVMGDRKMALQIGAVEVLPTSYLYAPNGELVSYQAGGLTRASIESYIRNKKIN